VNFTSCCVQQAKQKGYMNEGVQFCGHEQSESDFSVAYVSRPAIRNSLPGKKYSGHFGDVYQEYRMEKQRLPMLIFIT